MSACLEPALAALGVGVAIAEGRRRWNGRKHSEAESGSQSDPSEKDDR